ncbi:MAG: hypothetical protein WBQ08_09955 [Candidatus Sulfotelmatobacter sp.]
MNSLPNVETFYASKPLKIVLGAGEGDRMSRAMPPDHTPQVFEKSTP